MLSGVTLRAAEIVGTAVFRIVVSSDSMKNATATSHGNSRLLACADPGGRDGVPRVSNRVEAMAKVGALERVTASTQPPLEIPMRSSLVQGKRCELSPGGAIPESLYGDRAGGFAIMSSGKRKPSNTTGSLWRL
jgi:hypothetical protein